ncbi:MAG TPA: TIM barrel protein [Phnomibacter sp.]|nr:TIM barrel protein [Phnomibacter sp.]
MIRRNFVKTAFAAAGGMVAGAAVGQGRKKANPAPDVPAPSATFRMNYAFHDGMFANHAGPDFIEQIKWGHQMGFRAIEDNGMRQRTPAMQEKIGQTLADLNMGIGVFVAHGIDWQKPSLTTGDAAIRDKFLKEITESVDIAKRCGCKQMVVVPGLMSYNKALHYQRATVLDTLRRAVDILAPHGLTLLLETLNFRDHPSQILPDPPAIYEMCKAINSPYCKMQFDIYHVQISGGNIIPNIDLSWDEIGYIQIGDNPGRQEPGTGEINYRNVFKHLYQKGYRGMLGMEHGKSKPGKEGELALIAAYREADAFL